MSLLDAPGAVVTQLFGNTGQALGKLFSGPPRLNPPDFTEGFIIEEVGVLGVPKTVRLKGDYMPTIPFVFGGTQKIVKDYYPGNSEPTTQILGARESDVTVKGHLTDRHLPGKFADVFRDELDKIRIRGNLLRITLGEWRRYAFLEETTFRLNRLSQIEYELKFTIVGFKAPKNSKVIEDDFSFAIDKNAALLLAADAFLTKYSSIPSSMPLSLSQILNSAIGTVATAMNLVTGFVDSVFSVAEDTVAAANRALGLIKNARAKISAYNRRLGAIQLAPHVLSNETRKALQFTAAYTNSAHIIKSMSGTVSLSQILAQMQKQFELIAKTAPKARHRVRVGDTLQRLAIKYYGSADSWKKIYDHNKLTTTELIAGTVLEIPRV